MTSHFDCAVSLLVERARRGSSFKYHIISVMSNMERISGVDRRALFDSTVGVKTLLLGLIAPAWPRQAWPLASSRQWWVSQAWPGGSDILPLMEPVPPCELQVYCLVCCCNTCIPTCQCQHKAVKSLIYLLILLGVSNHLSHKFWTFKIDCEIRIRFPCCSKLSKIEWSESIQF